tara:strand:- start:825 stop:1109 length:285 start_codon:yes stop_codon:yes gene_type:complete
MEENKKLTLIEGEFSKEDARDILLSIFSSKINFYKVKSIGSLERYGKYEDEAQAKIKRLESSIEKIREIITEAKQKNKKLVINSEVSISFSDSE